MLQRLIDAGAPIDTVDRVFGGTPLMAAVLGGIRENVRVLLEAGADVTKVMKGQGNSNARRRKVNRT